jgi:hypothetical protein
LGDADAVMSARTVGINREVGDAVSAGKSRAFSGL